MNSPLETLPPEELGGTLNPWGEDKRRIPNEFVRCDLFNVKNKTKPRVLLKDAPITCVTGIEISYSGEDLRQDDQRVYLQLLHMAKSVRLGSSISFTGYEFCKAIGWIPNGQNYERLRTILGRLKFTTVAVKTDKVEARLSLVDAVLIYGSDGKPLPRYIVRMPKELISLFGDYNYTQFDWELRLKLPDGLPSWVLGYFSSHRKPFELTLDYIWRHCGSDYTCIRDFKKALHHALTLLTKVNFLEDFSITKDKVKVVRKFKTTTPLPETLREQLGYIPAPT